MRPARMQYYFRMAGGPAGINGLTVRRSNLSIRSTFNSLDDQRDEVGEFNLPTFLFPGWGLGL